jgi:hAT family C-terminal dimerisation region
MASSVSSERAFSQGGITITKRRNRLKGDIVEALQCAKCAIRHDLLFREPAPSSVVEGQFDHINGLGDDEDGEDDKDKGWDDHLLIEDEKDELGLLGAETDSDSA